MQLFLHIAVQISFHYITTISVESHCPNAPPTFRRSLYNTPTCEQRLVNQQLKFNVQKLSKKDGSTFTSPANNNNNFCPTHGASHAAQR